MEDENKDMILAEAVRKYPILYDKSDRYFKEADKKRLAWQDVAELTNTVNVNFM